MIRDTLLILDKHPGPTSFDMVREVRHSLRGEKVGHTGSLDPFASGVLVLLTGRATKLSGILLNADKRYRGVCLLGEETDTLDSVGKVVHRKPVPDLTAVQVEECLASFRGEWFQTPPMYSAKKLHGVRLYDLARQNIAVRRQPVAVQIYDIRLVRFDSPRVEFEVHCSKGTYVRSLAAEIGRRLGTVATLVELRRLACGEFRIEEAVTLERFRQDIAGSMETGYHNYGRLLRSEGIARRTAPPGVRQSLRVTSIAKGAPQW